MESLKSLPLFNRSSLLVETKAVVWLLGYGVGCATGLGFFYALFAIWSGAPIWIATAAILIASVHASIIVAFWRNRAVVLRRTALMVSMIASALLTCSLAWMFGSNGMRGSPLYGLALMHLLMAFFQPANFATNNPME